MPTWTTGHQVAGPARRSGESGLQARAGARVQSARYSPSSRTGATPISRTVRHAAAAGLALAAGLILLAVARAGPLRHGARWATLAAHVPVGAILPLDPVRQYTAQPTDGPTTIRVYPGRDGEFRLYEDDGKSLDYTRGKFTRTRLKWDDKARRLTIEPDGEAGFPVGERTFVVEVVGGEKPRTVKYAGKRVEDSF